MLVCAHLLWELLGTLVGTRNIHATRLGQTPCPDLNGVSCVYKCGVVAGE